MTPASSSLRYESSETRALIRSAITLKLPASSASSAPPFVMTLASRSPSPKLRATDIRCLSGRVSFRENTNAPASDAPSAPRATAMILFRSRPRTPPISSRKRLILRTPVTLPLSVKGTAT